MKIIQQSAGIIQKVLPQQIFDRTVSYRQLSFLEQKAVDGGVLLYNNLTKELLLLSSDEAETFERGLPACSKELATYLVSGYFFVPTDHDDRLLADQLRSLARTLSPETGINTYSILTTTACNARCFYCFEAGAAVVTMNEATAEDVAEYIIQHRGEKNNLHIRWFGGEPLCNFHAIDIISARLREAGVPFNAQIVSNAYLFSEELAQRAASDWHLTMAQVTLDGLADTYNRIKAFANGDQNAFVRVTDNIEHLLRAGIRVTVRLNMDSNNADELFELVDWLADRYSGHDQLDILAHPLFEGQGFVKTQYSAIGLSQLTDRFKELMNHIADLGLYSSKPLPKSITTHACIADNPHATTIMPDGKLAYCEAHADDLYGSIYDGSGAAIWNDYLEMQDACKQCSVYPVCVRLLKGCNMCRDKDGACYEYMQFIRKNDVRQKMVNTYRQYLKENER